MEFRRWRVPEQQPGEREAPAGCELGGRAEVRGAGEGAARILAGTAERCQAEADGKQREDEQAVPAE